MVVRLLTYLQYNGCQLLSFIVILLSLIVPKQLNDFFMTVVNLADIHS